MPSPHEDKGAWAPYSRPESRNTVSDTSLPPIRSWFPSIDDARLDAELEVLPSSHHADQAQNARLAHRITPLFPPSSPSSPYTTSGPEWWQFEGSAFARLPYREMEGQIQCAHLFNDFSRYSIGERLGPNTSQQPHALNSHHIHIRPESRDSQSLPHQSFANLSLSVERTQPATYGARIPGGSISDHAQTRSAMLPRQLHIPRQQPEQELVYELIIREQPIHARIIGYSEREMRTIDPSPILELRIYDGKRLVTDKYFNPATDHVTVALYDVHGEESRMIAHGEPGYVQNLQGELMATGWMDKDDNEQFGCFFRFHDLRCRVRGKFRLLFTFIILDAARMQIGVPVRVPSVSVFSDPFDAVRQHDFGKKVARSLLAASLRVGRSRHRVMKDRRRLDEPAPNRHA